MMPKRRRGLRAATVALLLPLLTMGALANSSWHWLTMSPAPVLPVAVVLTLAVETAIIRQRGGVKTKVVPLAVVALANLLSFVAPYLLRAADFAALYGEPNLEAAFTKGPYYIVLLGYLFLTLAVEVPSVYLLLGRCAPDRRALLRAILAANVLTTLGVAIVERLLCRGSW